MSGSFKDYVTLGRKGPEPSAVEPTTDDLVGALIGVGDPAAALFRVISDRAHE